MVDEPRFTANSGADLEKLTDMIYKLLGIVWGEKWGVFSEESPTDNDAETHLMPHITYNLVKRVHTENKTIKWTRFTSEPDPVHPGETITHYRAWFTCQVEFTIYDETNRGARCTAERFEEFMESYVGYFKQEGVSEILFKEEKAPGVNETFKQGLAYRTLCYEIRIERILSVSSYDLNRVDIVLNEVDLDLTVEHPSGNTDEYESVFTEEDNPIKTHLGPSNFLDIYNQNFPSPKGGK